MHENVYHTHITYSMAIYMYVYIYVYVYCIVYAHVHVTYNLVEVTKQPTCMKGTCCTNYRFFLWAVAVHTYQLLSTKVVVTQSIRPAVLSLRYNYYVENYGSHHYIHVTYPRYMYNVEII